MMQVLKNSSTAIRRALFSILGVAVLAGVYAAWKYDTVVAYYKFKERCAAEGGARLYEKVLRNKGWEANTYSEGRGYSNALSHVAFFRVPKGPYDPPNEIKQGVPVDIRYLGGPILPDSSYSIVQADLTNTVTYQLKESLNPEPDIARVMRATVKVTNLQSKAVAFTWTNFSFKWRDPDRPLWSLLGPSGIERCPNSEGFEDMREVNATVFQD